MNWPFQRAKVGGFSPQTNFDHNHANTIDRNASLGADGSAFSYLHILRNLLHYDITMQNVINGSKVVHDTYHDAWIAAGQQPTPLKITSIRSYNGGRAWLSTDGLDSSSHDDVKMIASDGAGVVLVGTHPVSSTTDRIFRTEDGGINWTAVTLPVASVNSVNAVAWVPWLGLWFAGDVDGKVFTSPDGASGNWTERYTHSNQIVDIVFSDDVVLLKGLGDGVVRTVDGLNYAASTIPTTSENITYNEYLGRFFVLAPTGTTMYWSAKDDGVNWSNFAVDTSIFALSTNAKNITSYGGLLLCFAHVDAAWWDIWHSADGGVTWRPTRALFGTPGTPEPFDIHVSPDHQIMVITDDGKSFATLRGGGM